MVDCSFNGKSLSIGSLEALGSTLDSIHSISEFELWLSAASGQAMCMLRKEKHAWLLYLRHPGDSGMTSQGDVNLSGSETYKLSNGQADEYPLSWCIEVEQCYKAVVYFFVNEGECPNSVAWHLS